jgi:hypothetical protein
MQFQDRVPEGYRHDYLLAQAWGLHDKGVADPETLLDELNALNQAHCMPPKPKRKCKKSSGASASHRIHRHPLQSHHHLCRNPFRHTSAYLHLHLSDPSRAEFWRVTDTDFCSRKLDGGTGRG